LKEWNTESSNGVSPIIEDRKRNVAYPLHFVALPFLIPTLLDVAQVQV
jgi:hypothetical protein